MTVEKICHPLRGWADITRPFECGAPVFLLREHSLEEEYQDPVHEAFLVHMEADRNPRDWLK
eukprot:1315071-Prorocentrum_lima.AAC.1